MLDGLDQQRAPGRASNESLDRNTWRCLNPGSDSGISALDYPF
ncbi:MAG: hypothetical protein ACYTAS_07230 [Planctomycetota bacterium]|jgi:hypothetical protein